MHRREDETLEGNYATDFSPYATWKVSKHQQQHASLQTQAFSISFPVSSDHHEEFNKARQTFHVPFESLVSKEHSAEVMLALHQTSSAVLARPTLFFLCAENYLVFGERSKVGRSEKAGFHSLEQNLPSFFHEGT